MHTGTNIRWQFNKNDTKQTYVHPSVLTSTINLEEHCVRSYKLVNLHFYISPTTTRELLHMNRERPKLIILTPYSFWLDSFDLVTCEGKR